ncbi:unnamed protein product [Leuciscus chuanchicus]
MVKHTVQQSAGKKKERAPSRGIPGDFIVQASFSGPTTNGFSLSPGPILKEEKETVGTTTKASQP